jgi:hypothetical protein
MTADEAAEAWPEAQDKDNRREENCEKEGGAGQ